MSIFLKEKQGAPRYEFINTDFDLLRVYENDYANFIATATLWPITKYYEAQKALIQEWKGREGITNGGRNFESSLEKLNLDYLVVEAKEANIRSSIDHYFNTIYACWSEIYNDWRSSHISTDKFIDLLEKYEMAINENKQLGLTNWNKLPVVLEIVKRIGLIDTLK